MEAITIIIWTLALSLALELADNLSYPENLQLALNIVQTIMLYLLLGKVEKLASTDD